MIASRSSREHQTSMLEEEGGGGKREVKGEIMFLLPSCLCLLKKEMHFQTACLYIFCQKLAILENKAVGFNEEYI